MARRKRKARSAPAPRARNTHSRQRQRLIEACISALHVYGPSRTTVEKVVDIADMSPGIVRFYFASKAAMLVASLQFLAAEFEEQLMQPVARLKDSPVAALKLLVDLYLDPEIASPRKVSVWYSFWGEASSRQEYYDICGQKDESFATLVHDLIARLIQESGMTHLEAGGVADGLIGVLEILWQDFAFLEEAQIDRAAAKARAMSYLRSIFPGRFAPAHEPSPPAPDRAPCSWSYDDPRAQALERERLFRNAWQLIGHRAELSAAGDYVSADLGFEQALLVRDAEGTVHALRNLCSEAPHALIAGRGRIAEIACPLHGVKFDLHGRRLGARGGADLAALELRSVGDLLQVRSTGGGVDGWALTLPPLRPLDAPQETLIAADWKLALETIAGLHAAPGWSARAYAALLGTRGDEGVQRHFIAPNHWLEMRADGLAVLQFVPLAPGRTLLRQFHFTRCAQDRAARAARYLTARSSAVARAATLRALESMQRGLISLGLTPAAPHSAEVMTFRRYLGETLPALFQPRPPA